MPINPEVVKEINNILVELTDKIGFNEKTHLSAFYYAENRLRGLLTTSEKVCEREWKNKYEYITSCGHKGTDIDMCGAVYCKRCGGLIKTGKLQGKGGVMFDSKYQKGDKVKYKNQLLNSIEIGVIASVSKNLNDRIKYEIEMYCNIDEDDVLGKADK